MTTTETKTIIEDANLNFDGFIAYIKDKHIALYPDGHLNYYVGDVVRFIKSVDNPPVE